jgi:hypothetical protein
VPLNASSKTPLSLEDTGRLVAGSVDYYNRVCPHRAIGYLTPMAKLQGEEKFAERNRKLEHAQKRRKARRQAACESAQTTPGSETTKTLNESTTAMQS